MRYYADVNADLLYKCLCAKRKKAKARWKNKRRRKLRQALLLEVVYPAKSRRKGQRGTILMRSNYRFLGEGVSSLWSWKKDFGSVGLDLENELRKLVKKVFGKRFDIKEKSYSGYLGVTSDTWIEIV